MNLRAQLKKEAAPNTWKLKKEIEQKTLSKTMLGSKKMICNSKVHKIWKIVIMETLQSPWETTRAVLRRKITGLNIYVIEQERVNIYGLNTQFKNLETRINLSKGKVV